jgi:hypothetical protein
VLLARRCGFLDACVEASLVIGRFAVLREVAALFLCRRRRSGRSGLNAVQVSEGALPHLKPHPPGFSGFLVAQANAQLGNQGSRPVGHLAAPEANDAHVLLEIQPGDAAPEVPAKVLKHVRVDADV